MAKGGAFLFQRRASGIWQSLADLGSTTAPWVAIEKQTNSHMRGKAATIERNLLSLLGKTLVSWRGLAYTVGLFKSSTSVGKVRMQTLGNGGFC